MEATAVFEAISVIMEASRHMRNMTANGGKAANAERLFPSMRDNPETFEASDMTYPAPSKNRTLHGNFCWT